RRVVYRHDDRKRLRPSRLRQLHRAGRRSPELVQRAVGIPLLADADRSDALGADLAVRVEGEHLAFLAGELLLLGAAREQPIQHAIDRDELLALSDKKDEEAGGVRRGLCGDDGSRERHRSAARSTPVPTRLGSPLLQSSGPEAQRAGLRPSHAVPVALQLERQMLEDGPVEAETELEGVAGAAGGKVQRPLRAGVSAPGHELEVLTAGLAGSAVGK